MVRKLFMNLKGGRARAEPERLSELSRHRFARFLQSRSYITRYPEKKITINSTLKMWIQTSMIDWQLYHDEKLIHLNIWILLSILKLFDNLILFSRYLLCVQLKQTYLMHRLHSCEDSRLYVGEKYFKGKTFMNCREMSSGWCWWMANSRWCRCSGPGSGGQFWKTARPRLMALIGAGARPGLPLAACWASVSVSVLPDRAASTSCNERDMSEEISPAL